MTKIWHFEKKKTFFFKMSQKALFFSLIYDVKVLHVIVVVLWDSLRFTALVSKLGLLQ